MAFEVHDEMPPVREVDMSLEEYGNTGLSAVMIFPFVTTEDELVGVLSALRESRRWRVRHRGQAPAGGVRVGVEWTTAGGDVSDAMGFAPLPSMPVPRRAPFFAIAAWPGARSNPLAGTLAAL